jgi:hypothetical protein
MDTSSNDSDLIKDLNGSEEAGTPLHRFSSLFIIPLIE